MKFFRAPVLVLAALFSVQPAFAADVDLHGFVQTNYASRVTGDEPRAGAGEFPLAEERVQLALGGSGLEGSGGFLAKTDFFHDDLTGAGGLELREAYADLASDRGAVRVGRQIVTWGTGDLLFVNDVFPKDWTALLSGRPLEYLKLGSDAVKGTLFLGDFALEGIAVPLFQSDRLPGPDRFFYYDPLSQIEARGVTLPRKEIENTELALKAAYNVQSWDAALYAYRGFYRMPSPVPDDLASPTKLDLRFPRLAVYGFSARGPAAGGVMNLEGGYDDSREDSKGRDLLIPNSQTVHLLGYQRQLWADFLAGLQYYGEVMMDHGRYKAGVPPGYPKRDRWRQVLTLRLTQLLLYQTLRLSLFGYWSPTDEDYYLIPEARYSLADSVWIAAGGNVFGGKEDTTFFGQFDRNDNVYVTFRYEF